MNKRWFVIEHGRVAYSCAERNFHKAKNFALDWTNDGKVVLAESANEAIAKAAQQSVERLRPPAPIAHATLNTKACHCFALTNVRFAARPLALPERILHEKQKNK